MKLLVVIVNQDDAHSVLGELTRSGIYYTRLSTTGGFMRAGNVTLLIGIEEERVDEVIKIIDDFSSRREQILPTMAAGFEGGELLGTKPIKVTVGGATVFVLDVDQFHKI